MNGAYRDDSPIGKLMHDFSCKNPADMYYKSLAEQVRYYKEDAKGVDTMCEIVEGLINNEKKEIALKMLEDGKLGKEEIAKYFGFTLEEVEELSKLQTV